MLSNKNSNVNRSMKLILASSAGHYKGTFWPLASELTTSRIDPYLAQRIGD